MSAWSRQTTEQQLRAYGVSSDVESRIQQNAPATNFALLICPEGTNLKDVYGSYTLSTKYFKNIEDVTSLGSALDVVIQRQAGQCTYGRLNWEYGKDLPSVSSLAQKGCKIYFDLPTQSGQKFPAIQDGSVYGPGVTVIRVYSEGTPVPSAGSSPTIDIAVRDDGIEEVLKWVDGRLQ